ncbi:MAG: GntR family transcriptional regulator [Gammaproteobacteria bacterium]|nr:GntR family transcriptional regulator [Gammaproteobacteria bacterium]
MKTATKPANASEESIDSLLRRGIREGRYIPGQRLVEIDLQQQLDASQRQVRDALRQLENEGLVTIEKNRGAMVRKISRREVECILDVLDSLSLLAVKQVTGKIKEAKCRKLIEASLKSTQQFRKRSLNETRVHKFLDENVRFWDSIATVVDNPILWDIRERLETLLYRLAVQGLTIDSNPDKWITHHEEILSAILEQNEKRAEKLVLKSSTDIRDMILSLKNDVFN